MNALPKARLVLSVWLLGSVVSLFTACEKPERPLSKVMHALPTEWDAATYLPYKVANDVLQLFKGTSVPLKSERLGEVEIEIEQITLKGGEGIATPSFQFAVHRKGAADALLLKASGEVSPGVFARGEGGRGLVAFPMAVTSLEPGIEFRGARFLSGETIGEITASVINHAFGEDLTLRIPLPVDFNLPLKSESELSFKTAADGQVNVKVTTPDVTISRSFDALNTVFCPSGLWVCADFARDASADSGVKPLLERYEAEGGADAKVLVKARMIERMLNEFGGLPEKQRTATVQVSDHHGDLFEKRMQADGLGNGGIKIWLENDSGHGSLTVAPKATWNAIKGVLDIACEYRASAAADLHVHVDPLVSGGVGTSVGCRGATGTTVHCSLGIKVLVNEAVSAVALIPEFALGQSLIVTASTNGKLKFKFLGEMASIKVPNIGVKVEVGVPPDIVPMIPFLNNAPIRVPLPRATGHAEPAPSADQPAPYLVVSAKEQPVTTQEGFVVGFDVNIVRLLKADAATAQQKVQDALEATKRPKLEIGSISLLVEDLEFGKNNDLVKILVAFVKGVSEVADAVAGTAKDVAREAGKAATNVGKEMKIAARNVERETGKVLSAVGHGVTHLGNEAKDLGKKAASVPKNVGKELKKVEQKVEEKAKDILKRPGHNLNPKNWKW